MNYDFLPRLKSFLVARGVSWQDADDVAHEIYLRALTAGRTDDPYLIGIARNVAIDYYRQRIRNLKQTSLEAWDGEYAQEYYSDEVDRIMTAIERLPPKFRDVIKLRVAGLKNGDIAQRLGITKNNVAIRITRARRRLVGLKNGRS